MATGGESQNPKDNDCHPASIKLTGFRKKTAFTFLGKTVDISS